jgi:predicted acetyltransferase
MANNDDLELCAALETDLERLADVLAHAFGFPIDDAKPWFTRAGLENVRTLKRAGRICGGLMEVPMGQWFGGRSVTTMGVAGVGIVPEERGRGAAVRLMVSMLREARARGFALSTLYPATVTLYRRVGYERAGSRFAISFDPRTCEIPRSPGMTIAEVAGAPEEIVGLYERTAREVPGYLDRGPYVWSRITRPTGRTTKTLTVSHGTELEGYVVLSHVMGDDVSTVNVLDLVATTARAANAILRLLVEYRSLATLVRWHGGPSDLFTNLLPERHYQMTLTDQFMVRVVDVERALGQRGWPRLAKGSLGIEVEDASLPENSGRYTLSIEGGRGVVERTSAAKAPDVKITERGLAALYSGHVSSSVLAAAGWLEASAGASVQLDAWFGGPLPTMRDFF